MLNATLLSSDERTRLLERRESSLRFSPLLTCICGAKNKDVFQMGPSANHYDVALALCEAGALICDF